MATDCKSIAIQYKTSAANTDRLFEEWQNSTGAEKSHFFYQWRLSVSRTANLAKELHQCIHEPRLPDLVPVSVQTRANAAKTAFDAAVVIMNNGNGTATGPFEVAMVAEYGTLNVYNTLIVPANATLAPGTTYTTGSIVVNIPFINPPRYKFDVLVDSQDQVEEKDKINNNKEFSVILSIPRSTGSLKKQDQQRSVLGEAPYP